MDLEPAKAAGPHYVEMKATVGDKAFTADADAANAFDKAKDQAQVIGSGLFAFETGVDAELRRAISDSALLAQLWANKQVSFAADPKKWFETYSKTLQSVGWLVQDQGWNSTFINGQDAEVNEEIVAVLTVALGAAPTALAILTASIKAMHDAEPDSKWITLFSREVHKATMARFQIGFVSVDANSDVFVTIAACILHNVDQQTQVLFFKWKSAGADIAVSTAKCSVNRDALMQLIPDIHAKTLKYQQDFLSSIKDL